MDRKFSKKEKKNPIRDKTKSRKPIRHKTKSRKPIRLKTKSRKPIRLKTKSRRRKIGGEKNAYKEVEKEVNAIASVFYQRPRKKENFTKVLGMLEDLTKNKHKSCRDFWSRAGSEARYDVDCEKEKEIQYMIAWDIASKMMTANETRMKMMTANETRMKMITEGRKDIKPLFDEKEVIRLENTITKLAGWGMVDGHEFSGVGKMDRKEKHGIKTVDEVIYLAYDDDDDVLKEPREWANKKDKRVKDGMLKMEILELIKSNHKYYLKNWLESSMMYEELKKMTKKDVDVHIGSKERHGEEVGKPVVELGLERIVLDSLETKNSTLEEKDEYSVELGKLEKTPGERKKWEGSPLGFWREVVEKGGQDQRSNNGYLWTLRSIYLDARMEYWTGMGYLGAPGAPRSIYNPFN